MYTKQEKLAAARKKLREFQGKQRENDMNRAKNVNSPAVYCREPNSKSLIASPDCSHESIHANQESLSNPTAFETPVSKNNQIPNVLDRKNSLTTTGTTFPSVPTMPPMQDFSSTLSNKPSTSDFFNNLDNGAKQNYQNGLYANETVIYNKVEPFSELQDSVIHGRPEKHTFVKDSQNVILTNVEYNLTSVQSSQSYPYNNDNNDPQDFFGSISSFDNTQVPNAVEANTTIPSISQLIEEKNSLMQVLKRTEELLKYKTDQEQSMAGNVVLLQTRVKELEGTLLKFENDIQDLRANNMQLNKQKAIDDNKMDELQKKFDSKEEQFLELQQKLELKTKECEYLNLKLNEVQSQLSSSMIKVQQLTVGENPVLNAKVIELQNENATLLYRIHDLEKNIEGLNKEKEESSLNFHNYAEQFNNQLNFLFSEVRNITKENQLLKEKNESLEKIIKDFENAKNEILAVQENQGTTELSGKLEDLTAENSQLQDQLNDKRNEIESLRKLILEKTQEINQIYSTLQQIKSENIKLLEERDGVNSNQKLLAAMESDKVAAARAVSQNQKLKDQVVELEDAFVKLSHEKLQLTDELAHEKHLKKELELRMKQLESDHNCQDELQHKSELIINEGEDIEELRNIIRQLENDKTELLSRLNPNNSVKVSSIEAEKNEHKNGDHDRDRHNHSHSHEHTHEDENEARYEESDCCKKILQQMEEKVKKTMNEIAALDEEKEKLEHLVLQLQGETETIGEYISLYQTQRMLLRQRSKEKDDQLLQLSRDKEELKSKLSTLNDLVNHLITSKGIDCSELEDVKIFETLNSEEASKVTVEKIQALITEIQSTNLINNQSVAFEHCPCCSGRLITI